ncbi:hypothetical protein CYMTET_3895 [Cymbomonas tetramitiformis]|uniref:Uncharacterized protein n=1 Tax=Cymbomonas tetramitiformis TaxID=36881 RepID=A0AAE0LKM6_9CHLO|nr:hypothetical protein CYMTET_3895 [Cymbomonas tetramitiformis]
MIVPTSSGVATMRAAKPRKNKLAEKTMYNFLRASAKIPVTVSKENVKELFGKSSEEIKELLPKIDTDINTLKNDVDSLKRGGGGTHVGATTAAIETARTAAEAARDGAATAQTAAEAARDGAATARGVAEAARDGAATAQTAAEAARDDAATARDGAATAQTAAEAARDDAATARGVAEAARGGAATAQTAAEAARDGAVIAQIAAEAVKTAVDTALNTLNSTPSSSGDGGVPAQVNLTIEQARTAAEAARGGAEEAMRRAVEAKDDVERAKEAIDAAHTAIDAAHTAIEQTETDTLEAMRTAVTAKDGAEAAKDEAVEAKQTAESVKADVMVVINQLGDDNNEESVKLRTALRSLVEGEVQIGLDIIKKNLDEHGANVTYIREGDFQNMQQLRERLNNLYDNPSSLSEEVIGNLVQKYITEKFMPKSSGEMTVAQSQLAQYRRQLQMLSNLVNLTPAPDVQS